MTSRGLREKGGKGALRARNPRETRKRSAGDESSPAAVRVPSETRTRFGFRRRLGRTASRKEDRAPAGLGARVGGSLRSPPWRPECETGPLGPGCGPEPEKQVMGDAEALSLACSFSSSLSSLLCRPPPLPTTTTTLSALCLSRSLKRLHDDKSNSEWYQGARGKQFQI